MEGVEGNPALHHSLYATQASATSGPESLGPEGWLRMRQQPPRQGPPGFEAAAERPPMPGTHSFPAAASQQSGMLSQHDQKVHRVPSPGLGGTPAWSVAQQESEIQGPLHQQNATYHVQAGESLGPNSGWVGHGDSRALQRQHQIQHQQQQLLRQQIQQQQARQAAAAQELAQQQQQQQALLASMYRQQQAQAQMQRTGSFTRDLPQTSHVPQHFLSQHQRQHQHGQPQGFPRPQNGINPGQHGHAPGHLYGDQQQQHRHSLDPQIHAAVQAALQPQAQAGSSNAAYLALQQILAAQNLQRLPPGYGGSARPHSTQQPQYHNLVAAAAKAQAHQQQQQQNQALLQHIQQLAQQRSAAAAQAQAEMQARAQRLVSYHASQHNLTEEDHLKAAQMSVHPAVGPQQQQVPYRHASPSLGVLAAVEPKPVPKDREVEYQPPGAYAHSLAGGRAPGPGGASNAVYPNVEVGTKECEDAPPAGSRLSKYHTPGGQQTAADVSSLEGDDSQLKLEVSPEGGQEGPIQSAADNCNTQCAEKSSEERHDHHSSVDDSSLDAFNAGRFAFFDGGATDDGDLLEGLGGDSGLLGDGEGEETCTYEYLDTWENGEDYPESEGRGEGPSSQQDLDVVAEQLGDLGLNGHS